ncbi:hypothetical protein CHISP_2195 [Chitinispirillum alkaliphilum]|nr:hypothetical protein CHISP_2195 [Chitinispirillum alkaliphilum]
MKSDQKRQEVLNFSILDLAGMHLKNCKTLIYTTMGLPLPLIAAAVFGFFYFQPTWYKDVFLWSILILFVAGQLGALIQLISLKMGATKTGVVLSVLKKFGNKPDLQGLQEQLLYKAPACHARDGLLRWIQLGVQGESEGLERLMEHAADRRDQVSSKILSFHGLITRTTLKLGFLGTLIGLLMTFEPMKQAMLSLQGSEGEFQFINDIVKAIDGNAYAILTTMFATGLSIFIELLTIQVMEKILTKFEMVNSNLDDWCIIHLQPWIKNSHSSEKNRLDKLAELQKGFAEKITSLHKSMDEQLRVLASRVEETGRQINSLIPLEKEMSRKIQLLTDYETEYRQFISSKLQSVAAPFEGMGKIDE